MNSLLSTGNQQQNMTISIHSFLTSTGEIAHNNISNKIFLLKWNFQNIYAETFTTELPFLLTENYEKHLFH